MPPRERYAYHCSLLWFKRRPGRRIVRIAYSTPTKFRPSAAGAADWRRHPHTMSTSSVSRYGVMFMMKGETSAPAA